MATFLGLSFRFLLLCFAVRDAIATRLLRDETQPFFIEQPTAKRTAFSRNELPALTHRPLIGILSQPGDGDGKRIVRKFYADNPDDSTISYIAASYVKFVESGGGRVVPLIYNEPVEILEAVRFQSSVANCSRLHTQIFSSLTPENCRNFRRSMASCFLEGALLSRMAHSTALQKNSSRYVRFFETQ